MLSPRKCPGSITRGTDLSKLDSFDALERNAEKLLAAARQAKSTGEYCFEKGWGAEVSQGSEPIRRGSLKAKDYPRLHHALIGILDYEAARLTEQEQRLWDNILRAFKGETLENILGRRQAPKYRPARAEQTRRRGPYMPKVVDKT